MPYIFKTLTPTVAIDLYGSHSVNGATVIYNTQSGASLLIPLNVMDADRSCKVFTALVNGTIDLAYFGGEANPFHNLRVDDYRDLPNQA